MQEAQAPPDTIEKRMKDLVVGFNELEKTLLPSILDRNEAVKPLQFWMEEEERIINTQVQLICEDMDFDLLEDCIDKIVSTSTFLEAFERDANQIVVKYTPYKNKVEEVVKYTLYS